MGFVIWIYMKRPEGLWRDVGRPQVAMHRNCHLFSLASRYYGWVSLVVVQGKISEGERPRRYVQISRCPGQSQWRSMVTWLYIRSRGLYWVECSSVCVRRRRIATDMWLITPPSRRPRRRQIRRDSCVIYACWRRDCYGVTFAFCRQLLPSWPITATSSASALTLPPQPHT